MKTPKKSARERTSKKGSDQQRTRVRRRPSSSAEQSATESGDGSHVLDQAHDKHREVIHDGDGIPLLAPAGGGGGQDRPPTDVQFSGDELDDDPDDDVGYGNPPRRHRFKKGQSGNPSGRRKKPKLPRHLGNQADAISIAFVEELHSIMMNGMSGDAPTSPYTGAKMLARVVFRDAMTKDGGYARKRLFEFYYDDKRHLDEFKPKDRGEIEMARIQEQIKLMMDPRTTEADITRAIQRWEDELDL